MVRHFGKVIIISILLATGLVSAVSAQGTGGIGGRPANSDPDNPRTQSIFIHTIGKGESKTDQVLISNNTNEKRTIELMAVDGIVTNTGAYTCKQNVEEKTGLGATIRLSKSSVTLEPNTNEEVDFTVTMPANADVGEHNACLVFQSPQDEGEVKGNIRVRTRQAIRVVATVPGKLQRSVEITDFSMTNRDMYKVFNLSLKNTGNVSADVDTKVYMKNLLGQVVYEDGGQYPVLADQKLDVNFENSKQPFFGGFYKIGATADYDKRAGTFGLADESQIVRKKVDERVTFIQPTTAGLFTLIIITVLLLGALAAWLLSRKKRRHEERTWKRYHVKQGDTIQSVADAHGVEWQKLAKRNHLKPPYTLRENTTLIAPVKAKESRNTK